MKRLKYAAFLVALSLGAAVAATPAGTPIDNQATATFTDPDSPGVTQTTTSNIVRTVTDVKPGVTIKLDGSSAAPFTPTNGTGPTATGGQTVVVPYVLTNTGNYPDTYNITPTVAAATTAGTPTNVKFYVDVDGNGLLDTAIDTLITNPTATVQPDGQIKFLMTYTMPGTTEGTFVVAEPVGTGVATTYTVPVGQPGAGTVFSAITPPNDGAVDNADANYHKVILQALANVNTTKTVSALYKPGASATVPAATAEAAGYKPRIGDFIEYTVTATNTSTTRAANSVSITDSLPAGTSFVSATFVPATGGTAANAAGIITATPTGGTIAASGSVAVKIVVRIDSIPQAGTPAAPTAVANQATTSYKDPSDPAGDPPRTSTSDSNTGTPAKDPVLQDVFELRLGPVGLPVRDTTPNSGIPAATGDTTTQASVTTSATAPTPVIFKNTLENQGTSPDTYALTSSQTGQPSGTTVIFVPVSAAGADGVLSPAELTAYLATTPAGITSLTVPSGTAQDFFTVVTLPANTPTSGTDIVTTVLATSSNTSLKDATVDTIGATSLPGLLVGNNDNTTATPGAPDKPKDFKQVKPGDTATFPIDLVNTGSTPIQITPSGSVVIPVTGNPTPAATPIKYFTDPNGDGDPADGVEITGTITLEPGVETSIIAVIQVPTNALNTTPAAALEVKQTFTPGTGQGEPKVFNPNSTDPTATGFTTGDLLGISSLNSFTFSPSFADGDADTVNNAKTVTATGSAVYKHTFTNTGDSNVNNLVFTYTKDPVGDKDSPAAGDANFKVQYSFDGVTFTDVADGGNFGPPEINLGKNGTFNVFIRVINTATGNVTDLNDIAITANPGFVTGNDPADLTVRDETKVQVLGTTPPAGSPDLDGDGVLTPKDNPKNYALIPVKSADKTTAKPGENITYSITATNNRADKAILKGASLKELFSSTNLANTEYVSVAATCTPGTEAAPLAQLTMTPVYRFNSGAWQTSATPAVALLNPVAVPPINLVTSVEAGCATTGSDIDSTDEFAPGSTVTMTLIVKVK